MPDREREVAQALEQFVSIFIRTLNKAGLYSVNHPLFQKAIEELQRMLEPAFEVVDPIIIGITINSIIVEKQAFSASVHQEVAKKLHVRKVKKIEIRKGVTIEELGFFFNKLALPIKEVFRAGGLTNILTQEMMPHLLIHKLDYSELLTLEGGEYRDIWPFLLGEAAAEKSDEKVMSLAGDFGKMIRTFTINEILEDSDIVDNIKNFLAYLKGRDKERFNSCAHEIADHIFKAPSAG